MSEKAFFENSREAIPTYENSCEVIAATEFQKEYLPFFSGCVIHVHESFSALIVKVYVGASFTFAAMRIALAACNRNNCACFYTNGHVIFHK